MKAIPLKIIPAMVVCSCQDCPFLLYTSSYGLSYDSGFDCEKLDIRIANDIWVKQYKQEMRRWTESQKTLFPMAESEKPFNPFTIPDNCPLEDHVP